MHFAARAQLQAVALVARIAAVQAAVRGEGGVAGQAADELLEQEFDFGHARQRVLRATLLLADCDRDYHTLCFAAATAAAAL